MMFSGKEAVVKSVHLDVDGCGVDGTSVSRLGLGVVHPVEVEGAEG
jgi:hypothetical protein